MMEEDNNSNRRKKEKKRIEGKGLTVAAAQKIPNAARAGGIIVMRTDKERGARRQFRVPASTIRVESPVQPNLSVSSFDEAATARASGAATARWGFDRRSKQIRDRHSSKLCAARQTTMRIAING